MINILRSLFHLFFPKEDGEVELPDNKVIIYSVSLLIILSFIIYMLTI